MSRLAEEPSRLADLPVYNREAAERHFERTLDLWRRNLSERYAAESAVD